MCEQISEVNGQPIVQECNVGCLNQGMENFQVSFLESEGFLLRASKDLQKFEVVFSEFPLVSGSRLDACVGCNRPEAKAECPECLRPLCKVNCKHDAECKVLKLCKDKDFRFDVLFPLRVLLLQTKNQNDWEKIQKFAKAKRCKKEKSNETLDFLEANVPTLELPSIWNFTKTNSFEKDVKLLYLHSSLLKQSCIPNTFLELEDNYKITIRTNSLVPKNSFLTISYTDLYQATFQRTENLKTTKDLVCSCRRCVDPTELGTYFGALKCLGTKKNPCGGTQLFAGPTTWTCDKCKIELPNDQMMKFLKHLEVELEKILSNERDVNELEEFLAKLLMFLHPNHVFVCKVKLALVQLYGDDLLDTKVELCEGLVQVARNLFPDGGRVLGELLKELFLVKFGLLKRDFEGVKKERLEEMKKLLEEAKSCVFEDLVGEVQVEFEGWMKENLQLLIGEDC